MAPAEPAEPVAVAAARGADRPGEAGTAALAMSVRAQGRAAEAMAEVG